MAEEQNSDEDEPKDSAKTETFLVTEAEKYNELIRIARSRIADLSMSYMEVKLKIDGINTALFQRVKDDYQKRDRLTLLIKYRKAFIDVLLSNRTAETDEMAADFAAEQAEADQEYKQAVSRANEAAELSDNEKIEIKTLFKKLAKLFHPDRYSADPDKQAVYQKLMATINNARIKNDIETLKEISSDADAYIKKQGWDLINIEEEATTLDLKKLYEALQLEIEKRTEALNLLKESPDYALADFCKDDPSRIDDIAARQSRQLQTDISEKQIEADRLKVELENLEGGDISP